MGETDSLWGKNCLSSMWESDFEMDLLGMGGCSDVVLPLYAGDYVT